MFRYGAMRYREKNAVGGEIPPIGELVNKIVK